MWAAAFAAALLPVTVIELVGAMTLPGDAAWLAATIGLFVVLHLLVVVRRRWPRGALFAASAVMLLLTAPVLPGTPFIAALYPSAIVYLVFVFTAAASDDRIAVASALALGLLGAVLMTGVVIVFGPPAEPSALITLGGFLVAAIGAAWALGRYRHESRPSSGRPGARRAGRPPRSGSKPNARPSPRNGGGSVGSCTTSCRIRSP